MQPARIKSLLCSDGVLSFFSLLKTFLNSHTTWLEGQNDDDNDNGTVSSLNIAILLYLILLQLKGERSLFSKSVTISSFAVTLSYRLFHN